MDARWRQCKRCHVTYVGDEVEAMFTLWSGVAMATPPRRNAVCNACRQTARDDRKRTNRWIPKCQRTLRHHAEKFIALGMAASRADFAERYGWDIGKMAHEVEHAYANGCPYCHGKFGEMGNGPRDITLDVIDPTRPPYYRTNCRWVCSTCNSAKCSTPPHLFGARLAGYDRWRTAQESEWPPDSLFGSW